MPSTSIVVDLGFGDAGKGTMVDALARRCSSSPLVVRHNGGAQAGHKVVTPDGKHHVFSQFGAATFVEGSQTLLSKHFILHPGGLLDEHEHLLSIGVKDAFDRLWIDERALVITPFQQAANHIRETRRGDQRHGTCGLGIGETVSDSLDGAAIYARDLLRPEMLEQKLTLIQQRKQIQLDGLLGDDLDSKVIKDPDAIARTLTLWRQVARKLKITDPKMSSLLIRETEHVVFEGAQGVLLDENYGFHPHTTWSTTTTWNADELVEDSGRKGPVHRIGVVRAYATRHGPGPFPTEDERLTKALQDSDNGNAGWQGKFRVGWFDVPLIRYALSACSVDELAVTCVDRLADIPLGMHWQICDSYEVPESSSYFHLLEGKWAAAPRGTRRVGDLDYQEKLGRAVAAAKPQLRRVADDPAGYIRELEDLLRRPVGIVSYGPTAGDKRWSK